MKLVDIEKVIVVFFFSGLVGATCFLLAPLLLWYNPIASDVTKADPEVVNGILTVSGIVFGFQFAFFKTPKEKTRILWVVILICEVFSIAWVGFRYVSDTMSYAFLTTNTLLSTYLAFALILFFTIILAILDWGLHW